MSENKPEDNKKLNDKKIPWKVIAVMTDKDGNVIGEEIAQNVRELSNNRLRFSLTYEQMHKYFVMDGLEKE